MTPDVNVVLFNLPAKEKEAITENEDGSYTIIINARLSYDGQIKAYQHAMRHIESNDFNKSNVQTIEAIAHDMAIPIEAQPVPSDKFLQQLKKLRADHKKIQKELQQLEEHLKIVQSMRGFNYDLSDSQQWYGNNI